MSELKYRVKIIEKNDGTKQYVPQVGEFKLSTGRFCFLSYDWRNIKRSNFNDSGFSIDKDVAHYYDTEEAAISEIEKYKQHLIEQDSKKVKSITYKEV